MTWAKLDDRFHSNRKTRRAWHLSHASIGLHAMALAYTCSHEYDGAVDPEFVADLLPRERERNAAIDALLQAGLWETNGDGWVIHDFLEYNPSADSLRKRRRKESERKAASRSRERP